MILSGSQLPASASANRGPNITIYCTCSCNKNKEVEFYYEEHKDVVCDTSRAIKHHICKTTSIQDKSTGYSKTQFETIIAKTESLKDEFDRLKNENAKNNTKLKSSKESCRKEIKALRNEINAFFDKLERVMLLQLDSHESEVQNRIDKQMSTLTKAIQMIVADYKLLEDVKTDGRKPVMFAAGVQVSKALEGILIKHAHTDSEACFVVIYRTDIVAGLC